MEILLKFSVKLAYFDFAGLKKKFREIDLLFHWFIKADFLPKAINVVAPPKECPTMAGFVTSIESLNIFKSPTSEFGFDVSAKEKKPFVLFQQKKL